MLIFLDIDGVLNQLQPWSLDTSCIKNLAEICNSLSAKIVLISSWRKGYSTIEAYQSPQIKRLLREFSDFGIKVSGITESLGNSQYPIKDILVDSSSDFRKICSKIFILHFRLKMILFKRKCK